MKIIENLKKQYINIYAKKLKGENVDIYSLTEEEFKKISQVAEFSAYIDSIIPYGFANYTIFDFNGCAINKKDNSKINTISKNIAKRAKDMICRYCWGLSWGEISEQKKKSENSIKKYLRDHNEMIKRHKNGNNIVIFGESKRPIGRTMLASIVLKEAFRSRSICENKGYNVKGHTYDWVDFSKLFRIIERDMIKNEYTKNEYEEELEYYKNCDWLVVDNIQKKLRTEKQTTFYSDLLDSFFGERFDQNKPTILVFKFDIRDKLFDFEKAYGVAISRILSSDRTFKIPLSENLLNDYYE